MISEEYRQLNAELHEKQFDYGTTGEKWAPLVKEWAFRLKTGDILDYGCGKGTLKLKLSGVSVKEYDPCIEGKGKFPSSADIVVCTDVLEHIEPDFLDEVLDHLKTLVKKLGIFTVATRPAIKVLPDGRNAHQIVEDIGFWFPKFFKRFKISQLHNLEGEFLILVEPL